MKIFVKILGSEEISIEVDPEANILYGKGLLYKRRGIPVDEQKWVFKGKTLADTKSLSECGITDGCKLHLLVNKATSRGDALTSPASVSSSDVDPDKFWESLEALLIKHYKPEHVPQILQQFKMDYDRIVYTMSLDDMERVAARICKMHCA